MKEGGEPTPRDLKTGKLYDLQLWQAIRTIQFVKDKGFFEAGTRFLAMLATFRFDTRLIFMPWQPE